MLTEEELKRVEKAIIECGFERLEKYFIEVNPLPFIGMISEASMVSFDRLAKHYGWYFCYD